MIWCVDDDKSIREIIVYTLQSTGFEAEGFEDSASLFNALKEKTPSLIILDVMLPNEDGVQILQKLKTLSKTKNIPIIMATAKGTEIDKVQSLDFGADDYLVKPFGMMEMVSRVKAVLRRCETNKSSNLLTVQDISMNIKEHTVTANGKNVQLTYKEFEILRLFLSNVGMVFTREQLFSSVWEMDYCGETRTVDMHVRTLRQKLGDSSKIIKTVRNVGYRLEDK